MNYKDSQNFIKIDGVHNEEWFANLHKAIEEKRHQLSTEVTYRVEDLDFEHIIVQYLRVKDAMTVNVEIVKQLLMYIFSQIDQRRL